MLAVPYDPHAQAPRFVQFMYEVFDQGGSRVQDTTDMVAYMLRYLGYALTGSTREQCFQLWVGSGSNGKTTLVNVLRKIFGDHAQELAANMLIKGGQKNSSAASPDMARLRGVRLAMSEELDGGSRWDEALLKQLTGSSRVTARQLHQKTFEFKPKAKIILSTNHKPVVRGTDHGIWRRIQLVPFKRRFEGAAKDPELESKLIAEAPGILALLVAGCLDWQARESLVPPPAVVNASREYREEQDVIGQFLREACHVGAGAQCRMSRVWDAYKMWSVRSEVYVVPKHSFNAQLKERGFAKKDEKTWLGLDLRAGLDDV